MSKVNVWDLKRPREEMITRRLTCPLNPEFEVVLTVRKLGVADYIGVIDRTSALVSRYITGSPIDERGQPWVAHPSYVPPEPIPAIDGKPVRPNRAVCQVAAAIAIAQVGDDEDLYSELELIGLMQSDAMAMQLQSLLDEIEPSALLGSAKDDDSKNLQDDSGGLPLEHASTSSTSTPSTSVGETPF